MRPQVSHAKKGAVVEILSCYLCCFIWVFLPWFGSQAFSNVWEKQVELKNMMCGEKDSIGSRMDVEMPELCTGMFI